MINYIKQATLTQGSYSHVDLQSNSSLQGTYYNNTVVSFIRETLITWLLIPYL